MDVSQELLIQKAHIAVALLALLIYVIRGVMMLAGASMVNSRVMLTMSSVFTVLLFALGVYMGFTKHLSFADGYMLTKIIGLLLFVAFGVVALKQGLSKPIASLLWLIGLVAFVYTYLIATHKLLPLF